MPNTTPKSEPTAWPIKQHDFVNAHMDSRIWNEFRFRRGDIVVASYGKSGCTWLQQIVGQLVFNGAEEVSISDLSPWLELGIPGRRSMLQRLEQQKHRRIIKTHLPVDSLVYSPLAQYLYIGRDGRDIAWSLFNHLSRLNDSWYRYMNARGLHFGRSIERSNDFRTFFMRWLHDDGHPFWPFWPNVRSWWEIRVLPNILFVHFSDLKADLLGAIGKIAEFLDIRLAASELPIIAERCTFAYMKSHANRMVPAGDIFFEGGAERFFNQGVNGGWRGTIEAEEMRVFERTQRDALPGDCAVWLETGAWPASP
jgi:aryl sulfotransferase